MKLSSSTQLLHIIQRTLNRVDKRLQGHGERVALIMYYILKDNPNITPQKLTNLYMLGLLHDIGAYKTAEIDTLFNFEAINAYEHSAYGYLFLKYVSPLKEEAKVLLYHHLPFSLNHKLEDQKDIFENAQLIHLADFIDVQMIDSSPKECLDNIIKNSGTRFSPKWVEEFILANEKYNILGNRAKSLNESSFPEISNFLELSFDDIKKYLIMIAYSIDFHSPFMVLHTQLL